MTPTPDVPLAASSTTADRPLRRSEDDPTTIVLLGSRGLAAVASPAGITLLEGEEAAAAAVSGVTSVDRLRRYAFLLDLGGEEALLLGVMGAHPIARGAGGEELLLRAAAAAAGWRRAEQRLAQRLGLPNWLVAYADALCAATSAADVHNALATFAHRILGAYAALVLLRPDGEVAEVVGQDGRKAAAGSFTEEELARLGRPGILTSGDMDDGLLGALWGGMDAVYVLHAPLTPGSFVFVIERRRERVFTAEDSDLFQAMVRQARATLQRMDGAVR